MSNSNILSRLASYLPDPRKLLAPFRIQTGDDEIKQFYMAMRQYSRRPKLYVRHHKELNNVECLISTDLSAAFDMYMASSQPERKALLFLQNIANLNVLGLDGKFLIESLFVKHTTTSNLGTHCIFGLRHAGRVLGENCFAVHLDNDQRIVMLYCIYQQFTGLFDTGLESIETHPVEEKNIEEGIKADAETDAETDAEIEESQISYADELAKKNEILKSANEADSVLVPSWSNGSYVPLQEVEVVTEEGNFIWLVDEQGNVRHQYAIHADLSYAYVGSIRDDAWHSAIGEQKQSSVSWPQKTKKVILRDLYSTAGQLSGKYVKVEDQITKRWGTKTVALDTDPMADSSMFDRLQAYYHIDRIQRYFRHLGLTNLDAYPEMKQLRVVLTKSEKRRTSYAPTEKTIYFKQIAFPHAEDGDSQPMDWTDARDCMVVYHEYVHAVTDTLAALRHQDLRDIANPRYRDMLQAAAMDEGLANYFACSLAVSDGARKASIGTLHQCANDSRGVELGWEINHALDPSPQLQLVHKVSNHQLADQADEIIYEWGEQWGRFLWALRTDEQIGMEVADTLIAHSILYLTRWSSFSMGILSILLADRLLFNGLHYAHIIRVSALNITQVSIKSNSRLLSEQEASDSWVEFDFGIPASGTKTIEDAEVQDTDLEFGIDPYLVDEWVFKDGELSKTRHRVSIE